MYWLPYSSHTSHHPSQTPCLPWISYATKKLMLDSCKMLEKLSEAFHTFLWHFSQVQNRILLHIILLKCQIAFLKFTSCDNQFLVGCIPIAVVAVHLNLKSYNLVSLLIRCIAITYFQESTTMLNTSKKKVWKLIVCSSRIHMHAYVCIYVSSKNVIIVGNVLCLSSSRI